MVPPIPPTRAIPNTRSCADPHTRAIHNPGDRSYLEIEQSGGGLFNGRARLQTESGALSFLSVTQNRSVWLAMAFDFLTA